MPWDFPRHFSRKAKILPEKFHRGEVKVISPAPRCCMRMRQCKMNLPTSPYLVISQLLDWIYLHASKNNQQCLLPLAQGFSHLQDGRLQVWCSLRRGEATLKIALTRSESYYQFWMTFLPGTVKTALILLSRVLLTGSLAVLLRVQCSISEHTHPFVVAIIYYLKMSVLYVCVGDASNLNDSGQTSNVESSFSLASLNYPSRSGPQVSTVNYSMKDVASSHKLPSLRNSLNPAILRFLQDLP